MDFTIAAEYRELKKAVRRFLEKELEPVCRDLDERQEFRWRFTAKLHLSDTSVRTCPKSTGAWEICSPRR